MEHGMLKKKLAKMRRPPWQLMMTSIREDVRPLSHDTADALTRIFELFPHISTMTIQTTDCDVQVMRDDTGNHTAKVDGLLESIFQNDPSISGIIFPGTATRGEHRATSENPHWSADGKLLAEINAALKAGKISRDEATRRTKEIHIKG